MLNELKEHQKCSTLKFPMKSYHICNALYYPILTFLRVCGLEGGISNWPPKQAGSQWKGRNLL